MPRSTTKGTCVFCGQAFSKSGMTRHLQACPQRQTAIQAANEAGEKALKGKGRKAPRRAFHITVTGEYAGNYWMHLEMSAHSTLAQLDQFLRDTWLECCGHLSAFRIEGTSYDSYPDESLFGWGPPSKSMKAALGLILRPGLEFTHEYDFGTTTELRLKVVDERPGYIIGKGLVYVMARNEAPDIKCDNCHEKPARVICTNCSWEGTGWLCEDCARNHNCGPDMFLPVVNSPRVGECGYTGDQDEEEAFGELIEAIWESYEEDDDFDDDLDELDHIDA
jgi:hypothetical protein